MYVCRAELNIKEMKKHLSFILLAVFTAFSLAFVSCGGGDDEPSDPTNGNQSSKDRIEIDGVSYEVSNEFKLVIWSEPSLGSVISFYAGKVPYVFGFVAWTGDWYEGKYCEPKVGMDISKLGVDGDDYLPEMKLNLTDDDEIECEYVSGSLIITALSKKTITLKFSNLKMSDGKGTTHTFNGTIKFSLS